MQRTVLLNSRQVTYEYTVKKVKNINLRIKNDGTVLVSAPRGVSARKIEELLVDKSNMICRALDKSDFLREHGAFDEKLYINGEKLNYLGKPLEIVLLKNPRSWAVAERGSLFLYTRTPDSLSARKHAVEKWVQEQCTEIIGDATKRLFPPFEKLGASFPKITFRNMTARWGSCAPKSGILTFNKHLIEYPLGCIEYVVLHELAHLIYPNHSKSFYLLLSQLLPDWKERKLLLENR